MNKKEARKEVKFSARKLWDKIFGLHQCYYCHQRFPEKDLIEQHKWIPPKWFGHGKKGKKCWICKSCFEMKQEEALQIEKYS